MYYNWEKNIVEEELNNIVKLVQNGEVIIFPTETVYGIGANALDENAVKKVFEAKNRPLDNPLIVLVSKKEEIKNVAKNISGIEQILIDSFMPGPFTLVLEKKEIVPDIVSAGSNYVGVRIPDNEIIQKIIEKSEVPMVGPSANISGKLSGTKVQDIKEELENKVSAIIDGGQSNIGIESTIVKVIDDVPTILRPGKITLEQIKKVVGKAKINSKENPSMNHKHYIPTTKCKLIYSEIEEKQIELINNQIVENENDVVVLSFEEHIKKINIDEDKIINIGSNKDLEKIMHEIFAAIRKADRYNAKLILIEGVKKEGLGLAIMNRLVNACGNDVIEK